LPNLQRRHRGGGVAWEATCNEEVGEHAGQCTAALGSFTHVRTGITYARFLTSPVNLPSSNTAEE
jgi:hypothetical protein